MRTLAMINQKGGCGKTTTAINLSASLAERGQKVLLVDLDPQAHSTLGMGVNPDFLIESAYDLFSNQEKRLRDIVIPISRNLDLAAAKFSLALTDRLVADRTDKERILRRALESCDGFYDFVIVDCPPNVGTLTLNALAASDEAMAILETSFFSLHGISRLLETLGTVRKSLNPDITVSVLATLFDKRTRFARDVLDEIRTHFSGKMYDTVIRTCVRLKEATSAGLPVHRYDPGSKGSADYMSLADEVIRRRQSLRETGNAAVDQLEKRNTAAVSGVACDEGAQCDSEEEPGLMPAGGQPHGADLPPTQVFAAWSERNEPSYLGLLASKSAVGSNEARDSESNEATKERPMGHRANGGSVLPSSTGLGPETVQGGVLFSLDAPRASDVRLVGDFNGWDPSSTAMVKEPGSGLWKALVSLGDGRFEYRYLVDGDWTEDPANPMFVVSEYGGKNSVLLLGRGDGSSTHISQENRGRSPKLGSDQARAADVR
jgi:chromosome partitioning protein